MLLSLQIALRFLFRSRSDRPLTLFTFICVAGITLSVALFLIIDSVMNGLSLRLKENLIGFDAPLSIEAPAGHFEETQKRLTDFTEKNADLGLQIVTAREFYGFMKIGEEKAFGIKVRSVRGDFLELAGDKFNVTWEEGYDPKNFASDKNAILVGKDIYNENSLEYATDFPMTVIHPFADLGPSGELEPRSKDFIVAGQFTTGTYEVDAFYVLIPDAGLEGFANLTLMETGLHFYPSLISDVDETKERFVAAYPDLAPRISTWLDKNQPLFKAMALERIMFYVLFLILVVISCLNLASLIRIFGLAKLRDTAVLRSLGASLALLRQIFLNIGFVLGGVGGVFGVALGLLVVGVAQSLELALPAAYEIPELPLRLNGATVAALLVCAPIFSALVAYLPARKTIKQSVTDVLRLS